MTQFLRAGDLTRLVSVQAPGNASDSFGGSNNAFAEIKKVYAKIEALSGRELEAAQSKYSAVSHRFTVHYDAIFADPKVTAGYRIVYNNRIFDIGAAMNVDEDDRVIEMLAGEGVTKG